MNQLLFIETFVLGAATIAAIYHLVLFIQQREKFLLFYSIHLTTLATYISFKLITDNYNPFSQGSSFWHYIFDESLQGAMVTAYVIFAAITLDVAFNKSKVQFMMIAFFSFSALFYGYQIYNAFEFGPGVKSINDYMISRFSLVLIATWALLYAWRVRESMFYRIIIAGSLVYDLAWLLSIMSYSFQKSFMGLSGIELYLTGCVLDIVIFSSAIGYRIKSIADEKNDLIKKEAEARLAIEKTRMGIAMNLHDDVGSVLTSLSIYGEAAKIALLENNTDKTENLLDKIGVSARETMDNMSDIVWTINPVNDNGEKLFNKMEAFASSVLNAKEIVLKFEVDKELFESDFLMSVRQNLFLIFKESINNIAKHAAATEVIVSFYISNNLLKMDITDNGKGFDLSMVSKKITGGNGLKNMRERAATLNGKIDIRSFNNGTETKLEFPIA